MSESTSGNKPRHYPLLVFVGLLAVSSGCGPSAAPSPSILLITIDTLRADSIGAYGAPEARTPRIDRLAEEGTLYERAVTPMPLTRPAHFSIFTSQYPREHGVVNNALSLPEEAKTLAEHLRAEGYRTGAFVGVHLLSPAAGADQGFDTFGDVGFDTKYRPARPVVDEALAWLAAQPRSTPVFLWVHLFDPHLPYEPPLEFVEGADPVLVERHPTLSWPDLRAIARNQEGDLPREILEHGQALYRAEVAYTDFEVGRLLDGIEQFRGLDETLVALTADHGECFENGMYFEHADCLQRGALRIPLILRHPVTFAAGRRESHPVSALDLAPTLLAAANLPAEAAFQGEVLSDGDSGDRQILIQYPLYQPKTAHSRSRRSRVLRSVAGDPIRKPIVDRERVGLVGTDWKYIRTGNRVQLFSESGDEIESLAPTSPEITRELDEALEKLLKEHPLRVLDARLINDELRQTLEVLGYLVPPEEPSP